MLTESIDGREIVPPVTCTVSARPFITLVSTANCLEAKLHLYLNYIIRSKTTVYLFIPDWSIHLGVGNINPSLCNWQDMIKCDYLKIICTIIYDYGI